MLHATPTPPIAPAVAWCDDCSAPDPVVFRQVDGDVHAMCADCWGIDAAKRIVDPLRATARLIAGVA